MRDSQHRTYGLSWSASKEAAEIALEDLRIKCEGGSVLLEADVPAEAIICSPGLLDDRYAEDEYIVDPRRLGRVRVISSIPQITHR